MYLFAVLLLACTADGPLTPGDDTSTPGGDDTATDTGDPPVETELDGDLADYKWLGSRVIFATAESGSVLLGSPDDFTATMSAYDRGIRLGTTEATTEEEFLSDASSRALDWDDKWLESWGEQGAELAEALDGLGTELPDPIYIVAADNKLELGLPHTRGDTIVLPRSILNSYDDYWRLQMLAHELFHLATRSDSSTRDSSYALLGFDLVDALAVPADYEDQRVTNPDAFSLEHAAELQYGDETIWGAPFLVGSFTLEEVVDEGKFGIEIYIAEEEGTGAVSAEETNYSELVSINTSYDLHPEEALADNFALLMLQRAEWASEADDQELVDDLEDLLTE